MSLLGKCRLSEYSSNNCAHSAELRLDVSTVTSFCLFGEAGGWTQIKQEDFHLVSTGGCGGYDFLLSQIGMEHVAK